MYIPPRAINARWLLRTTSMIRHLPKLQIFFYSNGNKFYIQLTNSVVTGLIGTLDVRINCDGVTQQLSKKIETEQIVPCGQGATLMNMSYRALKPLNVITSQTFTDWLQLSIPICMGNHYTGLRYKAQAADTESAMSSRACSYSPCDAFADLAVDRSGSALNSFSIANFNNRTLSLAIEGWGNYKLQNFFFISLEAMY